MRTLLILLFSSLVLASNPARAAESYYLYIPPIMGSASTPGYPGDIPITSFALGVNALGSTDELFVNKPIDSASPAIYAADVNGTHFPISDVLVYAAGATQPYLNYQMIDAVVSSYSANSDAGMETFTLNFASGAYVPPVPEPSTSALFSLGLLAAMGVGVRRKTSVDESPGRLARCESWPRSSTR